MVEININLMWMCSYEYLEYIVNFQTIYAKVCLIPHLYDYLFEYIARICSRTMNSVTDFVFINA